MPVKTQSIKNQSNSETTFLALSGGRRIAYALSEGASPGVVFLGGFNSNMTGSKAMALEAFCRKRGQRFLRFDYTGHGQSSGEFIRGTIGQWKRDALDVIGQLMPNEHLLVGSSMGAWLMLLVARERPVNVKGLVGIASAPDFTETLIWQQASETQKKQWQEEGVIYLPSCYGEAPYPISWALIEEGREHLLLGSDIPIELPVRLIHGTKDEDVPWQHSVMLMECLKSANVTLTLIKDGNHRLSERAELICICKEVEGLLSLKIPLPA